MVHSEVQHVEDTGLILLYCILKNLYTIYIYISNITMLLFCSL